MKYKILAILILISAFTISCKKEDKADPSVETNSPAILDLSSDKSNIKFGGDDYATITCQATGGNLEYLWEVDLGDIFVLNDDGSQVRFTGSECCVGDKVITCIVSNDKGEISSTVKVNIYLD